jgi:Raf kinase inhibitor-like YbhB/YbcL family protein
MRVASFMVSSRECLIDNLIVSRVVLLDPSPIASGASAPSRKLLWLLSHKDLSKSFGPVKGRKNHEKIDGLDGGARLERARCDGGASAKHDLDQHVFKGFGCTGGNVSPELSWSGAPGGTKSLAVSIYDPDAPTGSGWWHWVVFNIPPGTTSLPKGAGDVKKKSMPKGAIQSRTDFGADGYGGPCPPAGDKPHHYQITVFAVDVDKLPDAKDHSASAALVGFDLHFHTLAKATLTGLYGR